MPSEKIQKASFCRTTDSDEDGYLMIQEGEQCLSWW